MPGPCFAALRRRQFRQQHKRQLLRRARLQAQLHGLHVAIVSVGAILCATLLLLLLIMGDVEPNPGPYGNTRTTAGSCSKRSRAADAPDPPVSHPRLRVDSAYAAQNGQLDGVGASSAFVGGPVQGPCVEVQQSVDSFEAYLLQDASVDTTEQQQFPDSFEQYLMEDESASSQLATHAAATPDSFELYLLQTASSNSSDGQSLYSYLMQDASEHSLSGNAVLQGLQNDVTSAQVIPSAVHVPQVLPTLPPSQMVAGGFMEQLYRDSPDDAELVHTNQPVLASQADHINVDGDPLQQNPMNKACSFCGSSLFSFEVNGICCNKGRCVLNPLPACPPALQFIYDQRNFSHFSRQCNQMLSLTAIGVKTQHGGGFCDITGPHNIRFQGRVYHRSLPMSSPGPLHWLIYDPEAQPVDFLDFQQYSQFISVRDHLLANNRFLQQFKRMAVVGDQASAVDVVFYQDSLQPAGSTGDIVVAFRNEHSDFAPPDRYAVVFPRQGNPEQSQFVSIYSPLYEPLQYPLLFPNGESGWHVANLERTEQPQSFRCTINGCAFTLLEYTKQLIYRGKQFWDCGRLFNEYLCDQFSRWEDLRLNYIRRQSNLRAIRESEIDQQQADEANVPAGRVVLPASYPGSPRYQRQLTQDALAIVSKYGRPGFFITMTCNPKWPEIQKCLKPGQKATDRPDVVNRVFKNKLDKMLRDIKTGQVFVLPVRRRGQDTCKYWMEVTEFQWRGLPHAHICVRMQGPQPVDAQAVDAVISAEMPDFTSTDPQERLYAKLVQKFMVHKHGRRCQKGNRSCCYSYPKAQCLTTTFDERGYAVYRRRGSATAPDRDQFVVPHNKYLLMKYRCHINVEVAASVQVMAYLYKYIYKGPDVTRFRYQSTDGDGQPPLDEIREYVNARVVSASEACWRFLGYNINRLHPSVSRLDVHLPGQQQLYYDSNQMSVYDAQQQARSDIVLYFGRPFGEAFDSLTYLDFFALYRNTARAADEPVWVRRTQEHAARLLFNSSPSSGELFYASLLLRQVPARSWHELRSHDGVQHQTFRDAAVARQLVVDDNEAQLCLQLAVDNFASPAQLLSLFVQLVAQGGNGDQLFTEFASAIGYEYQLSAGGSSSQPLLASAKNRLLVELHDRLRRVGADPIACGMPLPLDVSTELARYQLLSADHAADDQQTVTSSVAAFSEEQRAIYNEVVAAIDSSAGLGMFIDAPSGRGKSYLLAALAAYVRTQNKVALVCASTGIAAIDYFEGVTAHSLFKIPVDDTPNSRVMAGDLVCSVGATSQRAALLRASSIIIWDEVAMAHLKGFEAVDALLKDITGTTLQFGGKVFVCAGDFRQIAPVVQNGSRIDTVCASVKSSVAFRSLLRRELTIPMRDGGDEVWSSFVDSVGNGASAPQAGGEYEVEFPIGTRAFYTPEAALSWLYCTPPGGASQQVSFDAAPDRAFMSFTNNAVTDVNMLHMEQVQGAALQLQGYSKGGEDNVHLQPPQEMLEAAESNGVPPNQFVVKSGMTAMIMRNLDPREKLMNGTRVRIMDLFGGRLVKVFVYATGREQLIPRINFKFFVPHTDYSVVRSQFPIRLASAITVNKAQGKTLQRAVLDLRSSAFSHGQLYVAIGRVRRQLDLAVLLCANQGHGSQSTADTQPAADIVNMVNTSSVIYPELL